MKIKVSNLVALAIPTILIIVLLFGYWIKCDRVGSEVMRFGVEYRDKLYNRKIHSPNEMVVMQNGRLYYNGTSEVYRVEIIRKNNSRKFWNVKLYSSYLFAIPITSDMDLESDEELQEETLPK